jgi:hypothetical protein
MYGASRRLLEVFEDSDVLLVVDDWFDGNQEAGGTGRLCFSGRALYRRDHEHTSDLLDALIAHGSDRWHGRTGASLFRSDGYAAVVDCLERSSSRLFTMNRDQAIFRSQHFDEPWQRIRSSELGRAWNTEAPHAKALLAYLVRVGRALDRELPAGLRIRIIVDRVDWMRRSTSTAQPLEYLGATDRVGVWSLFQKEAPACAKYLPLLGLVDSESWAWGRFQSRPLPSGGTVGGRALSWRAGSRSSNLLFQPGDVAVMLEAAGPQLADYWTRFADWSASGRAIELHEEE